MLPLILYDIPSNAEESPYCSPNTAKPRYVLSYKGLPFEIDWVELPDIAPRMKELGARTTEFLDGSNVYTLPVLRDPNTGALVTNSFDIAVYLDNTYPEKPVFPKDTNGLICAIESAYINQILLAYKFLVVRSVEVLRDRSAEFCVATREKYFNQKFAEFSPEGPERDQHWATLEKVYTTAKIWYHNTDGKWLMGDTFLCRHRHCIFPLLVREGVA
ncbi:hypothetical protein SCLCIDRAFT_1215203 [Scleroderma citrinum Foug A]|uniref:GST N-terminal domain-containing protein n=1 Tax=Scleroderma citrinum Foug A TaxID=1036808 RepID=A0A0C2ZL64_9AGAM|nr:hypothetical protein SCLCIDRAFT_1215203 [Scleroderma citrinum Foug A]